ncbi:MULTISPECIES: hypothetical protein [unclassified Kitasatospora]|uniref:hypothetical protein n=1 Tax=unclassified Kitasatospora TaxID=2633591 RepID=UPI00070AB33D|nr:MULTISPECIES: hypothetical protein [unclassified Kitasatospora]KQV12402.1 hypothetical protein ASC99_34485 [Kitasatospora sp. Root107]KRB66904.1 hypothetical protein ASE03_30525 [Kitasatospora sp. Root187]
MHHHALRPCSRVASAAALVLALSGTLVTGPAAGATPVPVAITVDPLRAGYVDESFTGFSYEKDRMAAGTFDASNTALVNMFKLLGHGYLRIGGNLVNHATWKSSGTGGVIGEIAPADVDKLAGFLQATGWKVIYGINGTSRFLSDSDISRGVVPNTADNAASEAEYAAQKLGTNLVAFEIGNEPNQYSSANTLTDYEAVYESFTSKILQKVPGAKFDGPGCLYSESWASPFATKEQATPLAFLAAHYYIGGPSSTTTTASMMMSNPSGPLSTNTKLDAAAQSIGLGWRMTEANSYYTGGKADVSNTKAASLWSLDFMEGVAEHGGSGVNFHGGVSSQFTLYYTPISFNADGVTPAGVQSVYYGQLLWKLAGTGRLHKTAITADPSVTASPGVTAWGIGNNVIVNNKSNYPITTTITLADTATSAKSYELGGAQLSTKSVTVGGGTVDANGSFNGTPTNLTVTGTTKVTVTVPAHDATVVITQ